MNPYEELGVSDDASADDIKMAYRKMSKKYHPDVNGGDSSKFIRVNTSNAILTDETQKKMFDEYGCMPKDASTQVDELVRSRIAGMANEWLNLLMRGEDVGFSEFVIASVDGAVAEMLGKLKNFDRTVYELGKISDRLSHKSGSSIAHKVIDQRVAGIKKNKASVDRELKLADIIKVAAAEYSYEDIEEAVTVELRMSSAASFYSEVIWGFFSHGTTKSK